MATDKTEAGNIKISDEAIATIAAIAAKSISGVVGLDGGPMGNFSEIIGVKSSSKGVKVEMSAETVSVNINLIIGFGEDIADTAALVQEKVREAVEKMTGLTVDKVNVNVNSVQLQGKITNNDYRL
jgi:uncharacterized alkaline shock family protein YloU